jgi:hypothetical protein
MTVAPNQKKLIIPGKTDPNAPLYYARDMRTIEEWANAQPIGVQQLIAGTNITLDPPDGEGIVTINASGSGGGGSTPAMVVQAGSDQVYSPPFQVPFAGIGNVDSAGYFPLFSNPTNETPQLTYALSWFTFIPATYSVNFLPQINMPAFTGGSGTIGIEGIFAAVDSAWDNLLIYILSGAKSFSSGEVYQYQDTDFDLQYSNGSDLSLVAGSGFTQNGLVTAAGGIYFASFTIELFIPEGTVFT